MILLIQTGGSQLLGPRIERCVKCSFLLAAMAFLGGVPGLNRASCPWWKIRASSDHANNKRRRVGGHASSFYVVVSATCVANRANSLQPHAVVQLGIPTHTSECDSREVDIQAELLRHSFKMAVAMLKHELIAWPLLRACGISASQLSNGTVYSVPTAEDDEWPAAIALYTADGRIRGAPHAMTGELLEQLVPRRFVFRVERLTPSNAKLVEQPKFKEALGRTLIQIQPMSSWAALETLSSMSLIASGAPRFVDVRHLAPIGVFRTALRKWSYAGLSDAYGCYEYRSPGFCCPDMESEFHPLPVACKLDILASAPFAWFFVF
jgi:hypothetical protein